MPVAYLSARTRDIAEAEDALSGAFAAALQKWGIDGVPTNPEAWLLTVARRRMIDGTRRRNVEANSVEDLKVRAHDLLNPDDASTIPDERLGLMFACAHPAIEPGVRSPLILQTILGFNAARSPASTCFRQQQWGSA